MIISYCTSFNVIRHLCFIVVSNCNENVLGCSESGLRGTSDHSTRRMSEYRSGDTGINVALETLFPQVSLMAAWGNS